VRAEKALISGKGFRLLHAYFTPTSRHPPVLSGQKKAVLCGTIQELAPFGKKGFRMTVNFSLIAPELAVLLTAIVVLLLDLTTRRKAVTAWLSVLGLAIACVLSLRLQGINTTLFSGMYSVDGFALFFKILACVTTGIVILSSIEFRRLPSLYAGEYYSLLLFACFGIMALSASTDLLSIYISLELLALSCYALVGITKTDPKSGEAAMKYFLLGAVASGTLLFGMSYLYGLTGSTNLAVISQSLGFAGRPPLALLAMLFVLVGFGFKIAMVPFHMWCPDTYEGAPTPITGFLSVGPKAAGFAVLIRVYLTAFVSLRMDWVMVVAVLSALTMTVGNLVALSQTNIKRMLAYSSIAQAGYILIGFVVSSGIGLSGVLLYLLAYLFMNIGAFVVVIIVSNTLDSDEIKDYAGLSHRAPGVALAMLLFLWSLAGLPPTGGFIGKFMVFAGAIQSGYLWLAVVGVLNSLVSIFYYFNVVRQMYIVKTEFSFPAQRYTVLSSIMLVCLVFTLVIGLYPEPFIRVAKTAAQLWASF